MSTLTLAPGVWPVMLTPFTSEGELDLDSVPRLVDWYLAQGCTGLFAVCQSSEMFFLDTDEKRRLAKAVVDAVAGRVQVVASGHTSDTPEAQVEELLAVAATGVDALVLVPNRLASAEESDDVLLGRLDTLLASLPEDLPLGWYECPYPYKRLLSPEVLEFTKNSGRFSFIKDTCCDAALIRERLHLLEGSGVQLYNANSATLLDSLEAGAAGYSGVMANFHPDIYAWLCAHWGERPDAADVVQAVLTACSWIEMKNYPDSAKHYQVGLGNFSSAVTRRPGGGTWSATEQAEIEQLARLQEFVMSNVEK